MFKQLALATALLVAGLAHSQTTAPAPSAAKKELVAKVLQLLQPGIENMAQQLAQQPAAQIQQVAARELQRMPAERREAVARDIEADLRKYVEEAVPIARDRASKLAPSTIGVVLDERFNEDELRQIAALLESPVNRKFQQAFPDMQKALGEKLVAESKGEIEPKVRALEQSVVKRLGISPQGAASGTGAGGKPTPAPATKK